MEGEEGRESQFLGGGGSRSASRSSIRPFFCAGGALLGQVSHFSAHDLDLGDLDDKRK